MVPDTLSELVTVSNELAGLLGKPEAAPQSHAEATYLHPDLLSVLSCGAIALTRQGIDLTRVDEYTKKARNRGMRQNMVVFGWHPNGTTWFAAPLNHGNSSTIVKIDRENRLACSDLSLDSFVADSITLVHAAIEKANAPAPEPRRPVRAQSDNDVPSAIPDLPKMRINKVALPDVNGATVLSGDQSETFSAEELGYVLWSLRALKLTCEDPTPDLSRWEARCIRACRIDAVPAKGDASYDEYTKQWQRITRRDRSAPGSVGYQVPSYKLSAPGEWILAPGELAVLRRAKHAKAPRHRPNAEQAAIWARFSALCDADDVELHVL